MNNYDAIRQLDMEKLESFLDQVFLAGLNTGMYAATLNDDSEAQDELLDRNPFDRAWLSAEAEKATLGEPAEDGVNSGSRTPLAREFSSSVTAK